MAGKRKPTYDLEAFKAEFSTPQKLAVTGQRYEVPLLSGMDAQRL